MESTIYVTPQNTNEDNEGSGEDGDGTAVYVVTFDSNGGSVVVSQIVTEGCRITMPKVPTKENYNFIGWYVGENAFDFSTAIEENLTLTAKWEAYEKASKPEATLASGSIVSPTTEVSLTCETIGADIYYTIDGTEPTTGSNLYTEAISIDEDMTIKAIAVCEGYATSDVAEFSYKVQESNNNDNVNKPLNPIHTCTKLDDGIDTTTWSYVYFGSYPQSEITDITIIAAIDSAISAGNGTTIDAGIDVWVDGTKYQRISKYDTNYDAYFGESTYRYFKWEPIKWRVLQNDGNTLYVMADTALDCKAYSEEYVDATWETSTIRNWLNSSFYQTAFSSEEQNAIVPQNVVNEDNPDYGSEGGNDTTDDVYLLSIREVTDEMYGFCSDSSVVNSASRCLQPSAYANARGTDVANTEYGKNCCWWIRLPGSDNFQAADVNSYGYVSMSGSAVFYNSYGVAPALHINLSSNLWSMADDGGSGETGGDTNGSEDNENETEIVEVEAVTLNADELYLTEGDSAVLTATITPSNATDKMVEWTTSDESVAIIDAEGKVTAKKAGEANITVNTKEGNKTAYCRVIVSEKNPGSVESGSEGNDDEEGEDREDGIEDNENTGNNNNTENVAVDSVALNKYTLNLTEGTSETLIATITPSNATDKTIVWTTSEPSVATVDATGKVFAVKAGTAFITATTNDGNKTTLCDVTVTPQNINSDTTEDKNNSNTNNSNTNNSGTVDNFNANNSNVNNFNANQSGSNSSATTPQTQSSNNRGTAQEIPTDRKQLALGSKVSTSFITEADCTLAPNASFTVTSNNPAHPTVTYDGAEGSKAMAIPSYIVCDGVKYVVSGVTVKDFKDKSANYKVVSNSITNPTVTYLGPTNKKKNSVKIAETVTYNGIKFQVVNISAKAFKNNKSLATVKIADTVTKLGDSVFEGCTNLESVTIGKNLITIGKNIFKNCKKLTNLTIKSTKLKSIGKNALKGVNAKCKVRVPSKKVKSYKKLFKGKGQKDTVKISK